MCICKPEFSDAGHNYTCAEQISEHDALSCKREKLAKLAKTESIFIVT